ncbi:hypothetical protein BH11BAC1_BH11BAC1_20130 [soil metagenome]
MRKILLLLALSLSLYASAQTGITWNMGMNIAASNFGSMHPRMVIDGMGNPVVIFGRMSDQSVFISRWNGTAFTMPMQINPVSLTVATMSWQGPDIVSKGDTIYVVMKQTPEADTSSHVYIQSSFDAGATFSQPLRVDNIADSISRFPTVTIDDNGNPIVAFMKMDASFMNARWVVTRSNDFGNTFSIDQLASGWSGGLICDCCPGALANSGNNLLMLYRDNLNNLRDMWAGISTDNGNTFTGGMPIDQNNWMISACPSSGPDGVIIGDTLYSTFMSSASGSSLVYSSSSSISSMAGSIGNPITGSFGGLSTQNYPRLATDGTAMAIGWKQNVNGSDQFALIFTNDVANGFFGTYDTVDMSNITNVDVAIANGNVYTVWQDDGSGTVKFRSGTFNVTTGYNTLRGNGIVSCFPNPAKEIITVKSSSAENRLITITNVLGNSILIDNIPAGGLKILNTADWENGVYFITSTSQKSVSNQKIIIQH